MAHKTSTAPATADMFADPNAPQPGEKIRYFDNGWRVGTFVEMEAPGKTARVQPILTNKRPKIIAMTDIERIPVASQGVK